MHKVTLAGVAVSALLVSSLYAVQPQASIVKPVLTQALPDLQGKEVSIVTVEYPPGFVGAPHRHDSDTFVYVLEGSIIMQVAGGKQMTLHPGETFYESPTDVHSVGRNASNTERAKFLVFFVKNQGAPASRPPI